MVMPNVVTVSQAAFRVNTFKTCSDLCPSGMMEKKYVLVHLLTSLVVCIVLSASAICVHIVY